MTTLNVLFNLITKTRPEVVCVYGKKGKTTLIRALYEALKKENNTSIITHDERHEDSKHSHMLTLESFEHQIPDWFQQHYKNRNVLYIKMTDAYTSEIRIKLPKI